MRNRLQFNSRFIYFFFTPCFHQPLQNVNKRFTMTTLSSEEGTTQRGKKETNAIDHLWPSLYCSCKKAAFSLLLIPFIILV